MTRDQWLERVGDALAPIFAKLGAPLPRYRVSIGFPSTGRRGRRAGECHARECSGDRTYELMIRPDQADPIQVAAILAHELVHAAVGLECRHRGEFRRVALGIGLAGQMTSTTPGPQFIEAVQPILDRLGPLPHAPLALDGLAAADIAPKQTARLIKCQCKRCGYVARVARSWIAEVGSPHCPKHGAMRVHP